MRKIVLAAVMVGLVVGPATAAGAESQPAADRVKPLAQAHAHNDYEHERPLLDALDHGFTSVEADVYLVDGELLVAHDPEDLDPSRTLQSLYLDPLSDRVDQYGGVYPRWRKHEFQLLVDIKNTGEATYAELHEVLSDDAYRPMFTKLKRDRVRSRAVTVVVSGDRPREVMEAQKKRFAFYDGRIANPDDLGPGDDATIVPLVSDNWTVLFDWVGVGPMPEEERARLQEIVATSHAAGQRVRFWATPDLPSPERDAIWTELVAADVDHINTDDLAGLAEFLTGVPTGAVGYPASRVSRDAASARTAVAIAR